MQRKFLGIGSSVFLALALFGIIGPARAASDFCLCTDNLEKITTDNYASMAGTLKASYLCKAKISQNKCTTEAIKALEGVAYDNCTNNFDNETSCTDAYDAWKLNRDAKLKAAASAAKGVRSTKSQFIPDCALQDELTSECRDISIFIILAINISRYVFSIIGGLSLLMFVYGGFTLIISQGSSEKIQEGKNIMVAVIIGLLIAFAGYLLVNFLGQSLGLQQSFRLL